MLKTDKNENRQSAKAPRLAMLFVDAAVVIVVPVTRRRQGPLLVRDVDPNEN